jgi:hypothetical protein
MTWIPVLDHPNYEVSDQGEVRTVGRWVRHPRTDKAWRKSKPLTANITESGHLRVYIDGSQRSVHVLMLEAFVGPRPEGAVARHLNGLPDDNRLDNLAWGTVAENAQDRVRHGRDANARKTHCPKGHSYDEGNTGRTKQNHRYCKACRRQRKDH